MKLLFYFILLIVFLVFSFLNRSVSIWAILMLHSHRPDRDLHNNTFCSTIILCNSLQWLPRKIKNRIWVLGVDEIFSPVVDRLICSPHQQLSRQQQLTGHRRAHCHHLRNKNIPASFPHRRGSLLTREKRLSEPSPEASILSVHQLSAVPLR